MDYFQRKLAAALVILLGKEERPGRTDAWWGNFVKNIMVPKEWKENFRMSKESFFDLCNELRPFLQQQQTNMHAPNGETSGCSSILPF